ncbi:hypothetical protein RB195_008063 [Necator americanus]|uniref:Uncharacterized protein n=1 Tax=Necator americanus TaxID=51031 RepID=A0ABR1C091_NECAM
MNMLMLFQKSELKLDEFPSSASHSWNRTCFLPKKLELDEYTALKGYKERNVEKMCFNETGVILFNEVGIRRSVGRFLENFLHPYRLEQTPIWLISHETQPNHGCSWKTRKLRQKLISRTFNKRTSLLM